MASVAQNRAVSTVEMRNHVTSGHHLFSNHAVVVVYKQRKTQQVGNDEISNQPID